MVSTYLVRRARVGTVVMLDQAAGDFVLPPVRPTKVLFLTAGSGITPVMGMLRSTAAHRRRRRALRADGRRTSSSAPSCACWPTAG